MNLTAEESREVADMASILQSISRTIKREVIPPLDTDTLERATRIKDWGRMARGGLGLGYGASMLDGGGPGEGGLSIEEYERINRIILQLPLRAAAVLAHLYHLSEKPVASFTAIKLGMTRGAVEDLRDQGLNVIYGATCVRIR